jgi:hypothetical protein
VHRPTTALVLVLLAPLVALTACSDDEQDATASTPIPTAVAADAVPVETAFDGDAFDAACELLTGDGSGDPIAAMEAAVTELAEIGGEQAARNTLTIAVGERCPEWQDALDAVLGAPPATDG